MQKSIFQYTETEELINSLTHVFGALLSIYFMISFLITAIQADDMIRVVSSIIFTGALILMFTASSLAVAVSIPIFSGGETTAQHRQAILEKTKAQVERKNLEKNLGLSIRSSLEEYETNIEKYKSAKEAANLANQAYKLTRARFATGGATRYDLNDSENALTNARIQLESTKFEIYQNKSNIKKLTQKVVKK